MEKIEDFFAERADINATDFDVGDLAVDERREDRKPSDDEHPCDNRACFAADVYCQRHADHRVSDGEQGTAEIEPAEAAAIQRKILKEHLAQHRTDEKRDGQIGECARAGNEPVREEDAAAVVAADQLVADRPLIKIAADTEVDPERVKHPDPGHHAKDGAFSRPIGGDRAMGLERIAK